jgi:uncharacterized protein (DUF111 family)
MTGEELAFACEKLLEGGALDVWTTPIAMKKGRPAQLLSVLCRPEREEETARLLFEHTTTIGIRVTEHRRRVMARRAVTVDTPYGPIPAKESSYGDIKRTKPEFDAAKELAEREGVSVLDILRNATSHKK